MAGNWKHQKHHATISLTDPFVDPPHGMEITVSFRDIDPVQAQSAPSKVTNWEYFNGALLAVCFQ